MGNPYILVEIKHKDPYVGATIGRPFILQQPLHLKLGKLADKLSYYSYFFLTEKLFIC
jgi:hypothetical protein